MKEHGDILADAKLIVALKRIEGKIEKFNTKNKLLYYNKDKIHLKQVEFHKCLKRNRWVFGGNRSGKTECGAAEAVWMARGNHPYRENRKNVSGWVVSLSNQVQRDVAQKKIMEYINPDWIVDVAMISGKASNPTYGVIDYICIKNVFGGISRIGFKSCEMGREKFQGTSLDFVWFDEEPPRDIFEECRMRVVDRKGDIFGTMTPLLGLTFIYNKIYLNESGDDNIWHITMEWADNPYLDKEEIKNVSASMTELELQSRRYGKFSSASGLVYREFDERIHVIPPFKVPVEWQDTLSIDPGLSNPLSCHWYAVNGDGDVFVVEEHFESNKDVFYHSRAIQAKSEALGWRKNFNGRIEALIDSAAGQKTLAYSKSVAELFLDAGIDVNTKVNKDLFSGISRVKNYLMDADSRPKLFIFSTCVNLIREIKSYLWGENDTPRKKDDHCLDELRYYLMTKPMGEKEIEKKSEVQLDKERLIRRRKFM